MGGGGVMDHPEMGGVVVVVVVLKGE